MRSKSRIPWVESDPYLQQITEVVADTDGVPVQLSFPYPMVEDDFPDDFDGNMMPKGWIEPIRKEKK